MVNKSSLGLFGIIMEAFKNISKNRKLILCIVLPVFLISSQLDLAEKYVIAPIPTDLLPQLANHPNMIKDIAYGFGLTTYTGVVEDVRAILLFKLLIWAIASIISLVYLVATVSSSSEAYTAKLLDPKDILSKLRKCWKKPLVTNLYMILLTLGIVFIYLILIVIITSMLASNSYALLLGVVTLTTPVCYFYLGALWNVSLIVSVLEEGSSGLKAIGRAADLIKGKRVQASLIMVLFAIAYGFVFMMTRLFTSSNRRLLAAHELAFIILFRNWCFSLMNIFMLVVFTIFYHEQKTSHDDKEANGTYLPIASGDV